MYWVKFPIDVSAGFSKSSLQTSENLSCNPKQNYGTSNLIFF